MTQGEHRHDHVRNAGTDEARFLLEVRPARRMEGFMRALFTVMKPLQPLARPENTKNQVVSRVEGRESRKTGARSPRG
jgi:hypothetical protein